MEYKLGMHRNIGRIYLKLSLYFVEGMVSLVEIRTKYFVLAKNGGRIPIDDKAAMFRSSLHCLTSLTIKLIVQVSCFLMSF